MLFSVEVYNGCNILMLLLYYGKIVMGEWFAKRLFHLRSFYVYHRGFSAIKYFVKIYTGFYPVLENLGIIPCNTISELMQC